MASSTRFVSLEEATSLVLSGAGPRVSRREAAASHEKQVKGLLASASTVLHSRPVGSSWRKLQGAFCPKQTQAQGMLGANLKALPVFKIYLNIFK